MWPFSKKFPKMNEYEQQMYDIISAMVARKDCVIEVNPEYMSYMLSLEEEQYFLLIDSVGVQISNHEFHIVRSYSERILDEFKTVIRTETIKRRTAKEQELFRNEIDLLRSINQKLNDRAQLELT